MDEPTKRRRSRYARNSDGENILDPDTGKRLPANDPRAEGLGNVVDPYSPDDGEAPLPREKRVPANDNAAGFADALAAFNSDSESAQAGMLRIAALRPMWSVLLAQSRAELAAMLCALGIDPLQRVQCFETRPTMSGKRVTGVDMVACEKQLIDALFDANAELLALYGPTPVTGAYSAALYTNAIVLWIIGRRLATIYFGGTSVETNSGDSMVPDAAGVVPDVQRRGPSK